MTFHVLLSALFYCFQIGPVNFQPLSRWLSSSLSRWLSRWLSRVLLMLNGSIFVYVIFFTYTSRFLRLWDLEFFCSP